MAANLTPQYLEAESEFKKAQTADDRLAALRKMLTLVPKHKASEKLQAELKTKISEAREACEHERTKKKGGVSYKIPKQGAGQYVLLGGPNGDQTAVLGFAADVPVDWAAAALTPNSPATIAAATRVIVISIR